MEILYKKNKMHSIFRREIERAANNNKKKNAGKLEEFQKDAYHEHEQQQHQHRQQGLCDCGRFNGPPILCVEAFAPPLPCDEPRSRQLERCNSDMLQDILRSNHQCYCCVRTT